MSRSWECEGSKASRLVRIKSWKFCYLPHIKIHRVFVTRKRTPLSSLFGWMLNQSNLGYRYFCSTNPVHWAPGQHLRLGRREFSFGLTIPFRSMQGTALDEFVEK